MLTRKKRIGIDSSPKSNTAKNIHHMSRETIRDTVNILSTPPTKRNRFMLGSNQTAINDDSPVLSQESINISWKWNNEGTPIRSTNKVSKLRQRSITRNSSVQQQHLQRLSKKRDSGDSPNGITAAAAVAVTASRTATTTTTNAEAKNHSPKGLYKFQEEMRKIQFDLESDTSCNNLNDKSVTVVDTGYPTNADQTNASYSDSLDIDMEDESQVKHHTVSPPQPSVSTTTSTSAAAAATVPTLQKSEKSRTCEVHDDDDLADDLFNDSDFDQILLTCQIPVQKTIETKQTTPTNGIGGNSQLNVKKASSAPEIKTQNSNSDSTGSNWNLTDDDCFDDLVKDFDIPSDALDKSAAKFTRHKSMPQPQPQPQQYPQTSSTVSKSEVPMVAQKQQSKVYIQNNINRKSFTRHESMPTSNNSTINRYSVAGGSTTNNHLSIWPNSTASLSSSQKKCTSEEIAEKRRQAIERLKSKRLSKK